MRYFHLIIYTKYIDRINELNSIYQPKIHHCVLLIRPWPLPVLFVDLVFIVVRIQFYYKLFIVFTIKFYIVLKLFSAKLLSSISVYMDGASNNGFFVGT